MLPRYHISYQQRQTQTRLSIPSANDIATILQPADEMQQHPTDQQAEDRLTLSPKASPMHAGASSGVRREQATSEDVSVLPDSSRSTQQPPQTDR